MCDYLYKKGKKEREGQKKREEGEGEGGGRIDYKYIVRRQKIHMLDKCKISVDYFVKYFCT